MYVPRPRPSGLIAIAVATGLSAWLIAAHDSAPSLAPAVARGPATTTAGEPGESQPVLLTARQLRSRVRALGQPLYWAGPDAGRRYELSHEAGTGALIVRYVSEGGGDAELTVATIPLTGAFGRTEQLARGPNAVSRPLADGGLAWYPRDRPLTVYVAHPEVDFVIEVYASEPGLARRLVFESRIRPID